MSKKRQLLVYSICLCVIIAISVSAFVVYNINLNQTFNKIERENLNAYGITKALDVTSKIDNIKANLSSMAKTLSVEIDSFTNEDIKNIMDDINENNESFDTGYYSFNNLNLDYLNEEDKGLIDRIIKGETVVSNVQFNEDYDTNNTYFGIACPVYKEDKVVGFVRSLLSTNYLYTSNQTGFLRDGAESYLIYNDGRLVVEHSSEKVNLIDLLAQDSVDKNEFEKIKEDLKQGISNARTVNINNEKVNISYASLPYNNWYIFNSANSSALSTYKEDITTLTIIMIVVILSVAIFIGLIIIRLIKRRETNLRMESERFSLLINFTDTLLCKYIYKDDVLLFTPNIKDSLAVKSDTINDFAANDELVNFCHPEDVNVLRNIIYNPPKTDELLMVDIRMKRKNGEYAWFSVQMEVDYKNGKPTMIIAKLTDNSKIKMEMESLKERADYDGLTGLYRYPIFREKVIELLNNHQNGILCITDSDKFKNINDTYGHEVGNTCLILLANAIESEVKENNLVGRYGGDEFVFFISDENDMNNIEGMVIRILKRIQEIVVPEYPDINLSNSFGLVYTKANKDYKTLFEEADECLYQAKRKGAGSYVIKE